tara:strand:- start:104 stop:349 length:246 start_codon:yes stop_codon:yes gene_type:complete
MNTKYNYLLKKHIYECAILPFKNEFDIGETVNIHFNRNIFKGTICEFVNDGTLFIKTKHDPIGRNYSIHYISSVQKKNNKN